MPSMRTGRSSPRDSDVSYLPVPRATSDAGDTEVETETEDEAGGHNHCDHASTARESGVTSECEGTHLLPLSHATGNRWRGRTAWNRAQSSCASSVSVCCAVGLVVLTSLVTCLLTLLLLTPSLLQLPVPPSMAGSVQSALQQAGLMPSPPPPSSSSPRPRFRFLAQPGTVERVLVYSVDNRPMIGKEWPQSRAGERDIPFWQWSNLNHKLYAMRHGYDFLTQDGSMKVPDVYYKAQYGANAEWIEDRRAVEWAKVWVLRRYLPYYDYLVFADSDAVFIDPDLGVVEMMDKYFPGFTNNSQLLVAISTDQLSLAQQVNGGFYVIKGGRKTPDTEALVTEWWRSIFHPRNESHLTTSKSRAVTEFCSKHWLNKDVQDWQKLRFDWPREQGTFNTHVYCDPRFDDRVLVLPEPIAFSRAHHQDSLFVEHLFGSAISRDEQQWRSQKAALNALLRIVNDDNFDSPELRLAKEALHRAMPDEITIKA